MRPRLATLLCLVLVFATGQAMAFGVPAASERYRAEIVRSAHAGWGLDAPIPIFAAQIQCESGWREGVVNSIGAAGLAQFMPSTSAWIGTVYPELADVKPLDPRWAIRAMVLYDRYLWDRLKAASPRERMALTLSAYNGGIGWTWRDQALAGKQGLDPGRWFDQVETVNAGRAGWAWNENRKYVRVILTDFTPRFERAGWGQALEE